MDKYVVYLIQWKNEEGHWIDYSRDQPTDEGLKERIKAMSHRTKRADVFRVIKRTITEEVLYAPETS